MARASVSAWFLILLSGAPGPAGGQTLEECLEVARRSAPTLQIAQASVSRAEYAIREARAALAPTLRLDAAYVQNSEAPKIVFPAPGGGDQTIKIGAANVIDVKSEAQLRVYSGGRDRALVQAAEAQRSSRALSRDQTEADLTLSVSRAFYLALAAQRLETAARAAVDSASAHLATSRARVRAGVAPRVDLLRADVDLSQRRASLLRATQAVRLGRLELETTIGAPLDPARSLIEPGPPTGGLPDSAELLAAASRRRPQLASLEAAAREAELRVAAARGGRRPQISLSATAEYLGPNREDDYFEFDRPGLNTYKLFATMALGWPLLDGGLTAARVGQLEADRLAAEARRREAALAVRRDVERSLSDLRLAFAVWQSDSGRIHVAEEALRLAVAGYKGGTATASDVRDAEAALAAARAEEAESKMDYWIARAELEHAIGSPARKE